MHGEDAQMTEERPPEGQPAPAAGAPPEPPPAPAPPPIAPYLSPSATPAAAPQPAVAWAAPPPVAVPVDGARTTAAAAAGVILLVLGILGALVSLLVLLAAGMVGSLGNSGAFDEVPGMPAGFERIIGGLFLVVAIIIIGYTVLAIAGGIGVLRSRSWGRVLGIIVGVIGTLTWLAGVFSPDSNRGGAIFAFVLLAVHLYIAIILIGYWKVRPAS
jgi:hypothetical protein